MYMSSIIIQKTLFLPHMRIFSPLCGASVDIDRIPSHSTIFAAIKFIKFLDVLFAHLKVEHLNVGTYAIRVLRLWERNKIMLQRPTNEYLCRVLAILVCKFLQHRVSKFSPDQGSICLDDDVMRAAVIHDISLLAERVKLYLIDRWRFESCFADFFKMLNIVIGHTHRPDFTCFPGSQERLPSLKAGCFPPVGAMYEIEVQVIETKALERVINGGKAALVTTSDLIDLGR
jgi:hypothetical protein